MSDRLLQALVMTCVLVASDAGVPVGQEQWKPTPEVKRTTPVDQATLFGKPDLIVELRVSKSCESEVNSDVDRFEPVKPSDNILRTVALPSGSTHEHPRSLTSR